LDLSTQREEAAVEDTRWSDALERLAFHKNNGYGDTLGRQTARRVVDALRMAGQLQDDDLVSVVAARGASVRALKTLQKIIERA
jgi:hypothetical protein